MNKAIFVLRCFYGRARLSGADLRSELRRSRPVRAQALRVAALLALLLPSVAAHAAPPAQGAPAPAGPAADLDQAIQKTLGKDEFAWRLPHEQGPAGNAGFFTKLLYRIGGDIRGALRGLFNTLGGFFKWLFENQRDHDSANQTLSTLAAVPWRLVIILVALLLVGLFLYLVLRHYRRRRDLPVAGAAKPPAIRTVDLEADHVQADELPEDSWLALAQQLIDRGELRLALRAFYLATLSTLARQELVRLAAAKSNRDYLAELSRRLRGQTAVVPFFRENVRLFEASWYGTHDVTTAVLDAMRRNQRQVQGHAAA